MLLVEICTKLDVVKAQDFNFISNNERRDICTSKIVRKTAKVFK